MQQTTGSWVVYLMTLRKSAGGMRAVCDQGEWDAMELAHPGYHTLIQAGIASEVEAEALARGDSGKDWKCRPASRPAGLPAS